MISMPIDPGFCACGKPLHYSNPLAQRMVEQLIREAGENVKVTIGLKHWLVQRHYIALHGLKAVELPGLGFPEVGPDEVVLRAESYIPPEFP